MSEASQWMINGREASQRDVAEALALQRQHRAKITKADREARERDYAARAVGAEIRKAVRHTIGCKPKSVLGRNEGSRRLSRFERLLGSATWTQHGDKNGGVSSFHFKLTPRGLGKRRQASGRTYRRGEIVKAIRYILRNAAREIANGGVVSNVSRDPDVLATVFSALEELEMMAGRDNANVYVSLIISLPAELTSDERLRLLQEVCRFLSDRGLAYAGVLHAPDREGDQRNYHAHVLFSWRPLTLTKDGCAFATEARGALNTPAFVRGFRAHAATAMNAAMVEAGHARRFTAEKTRVGPGSSKSEKLGPGRKHRDRRAERIAVSEKNLSELKDWRLALHTATAAVQAWLVRPAIDRSAILAVLREREREIAAVGPALAMKQPSVDAAPTVGPAPATAVSHEKLADDFALASGNATADEKVSQSSEKLTTHAPAALMPKRSVDDKTLGKPIGGAPTFSATEAPSSLRVASPSRAAAQQQAAAVMALWRSLDDARNTAGPKGLQSARTLAGLAARKMGTLPGLARLAADNRTPVDPQVTRIVLAPSTGSNLDPQLPPQSEPHQQSQTINSSKASGGDRSYDMGKKPEPVKPLDQVGNRSTAAPDREIRDGPERHSQATVSTAQRPRDVLRNQARARAVKDQRQRPGRVDDLIRDLAEVQFIPVLKKRNLDGGRSQEYFVFKPPSPDDGNAALIRAAIAVQDTERMQALLRDAFAKLHRDAQEMPGEKRAALLKSDKSDAEIDIADKSDAVREHAPPHMHLDGGQAPKTEESDEALGNLLDRYNRTRSSSWSR